MLWLVAAFTGLATSGCELNDGPARYTILLYVLDRPQYHVQDAKYWKESAEEQTGWRDLYVVHEASESKLYRGKYNKLSKAESDLAKARQFRTRSTEEAPSGVPVFLTARIVPAPGMDLGPPEWRLVNKTQETRYTLVVAEFHSEGGFNEPEHYAVDYCRELRDKGYEAYLHYTPVKSYVTIGDFPETSYQMVTTRQASEELHHRGWALPTIPDPKLKKLVQDFPELAVNGRRVIIREVNPMTGEKQEFAEPSFIMDIPRASNLYDD